MSAEGSSRCRFYIMSFWLCNVGRRGAVVMIARCHLDAFRRGVPRQHRSLGRSLLRVTLTLIRCRYKMENARARTFDVVLNIHRPSDNTHRSLPRRACKLMSRGRQVHIRRRLHHRTPFLRYTLTQLLLRSKRSSGQSGSSTRRRRVRFLWGFSSWPCSNSFRRRRS